MNNKDMQFNKYKNCLNIDIKKCTFLGQGRNGQVYLLPDGKVLKVFFREEDCKHEYDILQSVKGNKEINDQLFQDWNAKYIYDKKNNIHY